MPHSIGECDKYNAMSFLKLLARFGGPGSAARWAAKLYRQMRTREPWNDMRAFRDIDVFRLMVASRYVLIPHRRAQELLREWLQDENQGLVSVVTGIVIAESKWEPFEFPHVLREVIHEELAKSGLPESVLYGIPAGATHPKQVGRIIRVLLVEPDDGLARFFTKAIRGCAFEDADFEVFVLPHVNAKELYELAAYQGWDLAVVNLNVVSADLVKTMSDDYHKPVVGIAGAHHTLDHLRQILGAGARGLVHIPCSAEVFGKTITQCLALA
jgi:hypothetical protein